jgi:uncharacterized protein (DUF924 family)
MDLEVIARPIISTPAKEILEYWFSSLTDETALDRNQEPFRTCFQRWYGKDPAIDAEIRTRFEPVLLEATRDGQRLDRVLADWEQQPQGLLALVILLDQLPRNMYRGSAKMYDHDPLALAVTMRAIENHPDGASLPLVWQMFLYVPLMHVENLTLQQYMLMQFESLTERARVRSPKNQPFFAFACDYARQHVQIVEKFGRFPHRNALLNRRSTAEEEAFLVTHTGF